MIGLCKLCKKESKLLKQSHIIPDFLYKPIRGKDGEFYAVSSFKKRNTSRKVYTGYFERHILCQKCDNEVLGKYEGYFAKVLNNLNIRKLEGSQKINNNGVKYIEIGPIDYKKTKLFFLSIIWRSSISSLNEFSRIKLTPKQEEELRLMILNDVPGPENYYPIFPLMIPGKSLVVTKTFRECNAEGYNFFSLVINGTPHIFFIQNHAPLWALEHGPRSSGIFSVVLLNNEQGKMLIDSWIEETVNILKNR